MIASEIREHLFSTLRLAIPLIFVNIATFAVGPVSIAFCGHLGTFELDAVSLANSVISFTVISIFDGIATACDTLMSQIFGASNKKLIGVVLQRTLYILALFSLLTIAIFLNAERILLLLGQDPKVSNMSGNYLMGMIPAVLAYVVSVALKKYMTTQNKVLPVFIAALLGNCVNTFFHWLFLYKYNLGYMGSAYSQSLAYISNGGSLLLYILCSGFYKETWNGWISDAFQEWGVYFTLGSGGLIMLLVEIGSYECGVIFAGLLDTESLGAQAIIMQLETICYLIPLGVGISTSIQVGQSLGSSNPTKAKSVVLFGYIVGECLALMTLALVLSLRNYLPYIFTSDQNIVELVSKVLLVISVYPIFDTLLCVGNLTLRGTGKVWTGAIILTCCHGLGISIGIPTMLSKSDIMYFWLVLLSAIIFAGIVNFIVISRMNWNQLVSKALERAKVSAKDDATENNSFQFTFSENTNLLPSKKERYRPTYSRRFSSYDPYQQNNKEVLDSAFITNRSEYLSTSQLLIRRGSFISIFIAIFLSSLLLRLYLPVKHDITDNTTMITPFLTDSTVLTEIY